MKDRKKIVIIISKTNLLMRDNKVVMSAELKVRLPGYKF